ncbi:MAG: leucyl aminopeptidase, partial [Actinomycetia bacterium]|nr:leucyl aminopeptidase [Actinomycetes bacterium]
MPTVSTSTAVPRSATAFDLPVAADELGDLPADVGQYAANQGFEGKAGQTLAMPAPRSSNRSQILVGIGPRKDVSPTVLRTAAAALARSVSKHETVATSLVAQVDEDDRDGAIAAVVEGIKLATYRYTGYKSGPKPTLRRVAVLAKGRGVKAAAERAAELSDAVMLARDLSNEPGGSLTPAAFAAKAKELGTASGFKVSVWDERRITREKLGGLLAVNQGSENPPRFLKMSYTPAKKAKGRVALVGKGITFDSGGLSLKNSAGMATMKVDMSGGAIVLAAMTVLGSAGVQVAVDGYIPLTDNMTGGNAQRPGDVFTARNGKTVEVLNTDAEGRLVLADALSVAAESNVDA